MQGANDTYQQRLDSLSITGDEEINRINKMINCDHLFVKLQHPIEFTCAWGGKEFGTKPPLMQCVHCGLTNKFKEDDDLGNQKVLVSGSILNSVTVETKVFNSTYKKCYHREKYYGYIKCSFDDSEIPYISREVLDTYHPGLLFDLAREINLSLDYTNPHDREELFRIMKELREIETYHERLCLKHTMDATELLERYCEKHDIKRIIR